MEFDPRQVWGYSNFGSPTHVSLIFRKSDERKVIQSKSDHAQTFLEADLVSKLMTIIGWVGLGWAHYELERFSLPCTKPTLFPSLALTHVHTPLGCSKARPALLKPLWPGLKSKFLAHLINGLALD